MRADDAELWYEPALAVFLHEWYADARSAQAALRTRGDYLLPYRDHAYRCGPDSIRALGLDPADPDWAHIRHNGLRPADPAAWQRLYERRRAHRSARVAARPST